jgi:HSP20 family protein
MPFDLIPKKMFLWDEDDDFLTTPTSSAQNGLSVSEDENKIYVEAAVPGIDPKNVEITFHEGYLWIRGEQEQEEKDKKKKYYRRASQSFSYRVAIPGDVDIKKEPEAIYKRGIMKITFDKSPKVQPKKITIKSVEK